MHEATKLARIYTCTMILHMYMTVHNVWGTMFLHVCM